MPQSIARIYVHLVFATRYRQPIIGDDVRLPLHEFIRGVLHTRGDYPEAINSVEDHIHILLQLGRMSTISATVEDVKTTSSKWLKQQTPRYRDFHWQKGYGAFAICHDRLLIVRRYIARQQQHHAKTTFESEYRDHLARHNLEPDPRDMSWEYPPVSAGRRGAALPRPSAWEAIGPPPASAISRFPDRWSGPGQRRASGAAPAPRFFSHIYEIS